ncbi:MAG: 4-hydroxy-3-methylbut-2-enyl diphosphate reductase, partial [Candidatus Erginobacter occultus]|nr:4-hydroxy-3-methylbut-2-enyl diphosphate reductase [Candidatus Erginobacter occultus]
ALEMVLDRARREEKKRIVTYGPLIHNPQVVALLSSKRISATRDRGEFTPDDICFISAHGISPQTRRDLRSTGARVCDASCPDVLKVQGTIRKYARQGYVTVIFGDRGHSEVEGLLGFTEGRGVVVGSPEEAAKIPHSDRVCLVSQTTQNLDDYRAVADEVRKRSPEALVFETICASTRERQSEVLEMSGKVDALVVVGGKNSANTARLTRLAAGRVPVFQVETADDLDRSRLEKYKTVGVTAGASTPNWLIQEVIDRLQDWSWERRSRLLKAVHRLGSVLVKSNIYIALGGAALTCASMRLLQLPLSRSAILLSFFLVLAVYNLNIFADRSAILLTQPSRYRFLLAHRKKLYGLSAISLAAAFILAASLGTAAFILTVFTLLSGLAYSFTFLPTALPGIRLKNLTGLKEFFSSLGWGVLAVLIPVLSTPGTPPRLVPVAVVLIFVFSILFVRSVLFAIRDLQGDRLVGRETIPVVLGVRQTKLLLFSLMAFAAGLMVLAAARGWISPIGYRFPVVIGYGCLYLLLYHKRLVYQGLPHELLVDSQLLLAGVISCGG